MRACSRAQGPLLSALCKHEGNPKKRGCMYTCHWLTFQYNRSEHSIVKQLCECSVAQSCPILCNPMDYSPPGFSVHGIFQARVLEWIAISYSRGSSRPRDRTHVSWLSCSGRQFFFFFFFTTGKATILQ